jgi:hypothetical protein
MKLGEFRNIFPNKYGQLIEPILMNEKTPYDLFFMTLRASWDLRKEDSKD